MASQALLKAIPSGIHVARNAWIWNHFFIHTAIVNIVGFTLTLWMGAIPMSRFPITFGSSQKKFTCIPDYASGMIVTTVKKNARYVSAI